ncbi:MAG: DUF4388 domain-containing protein [Alphaproteobacteria bacterium]|nr:DUF4388 domain-containing protein [Alphaproteobacteria bacterium]
MNTALRDELLHHLDANAIGCLSVVSPGGQLRLYLMNGEILAAESPEDDVQLLRRVVVADLLERGRAADLMRTSSTEEVPVSELLFDVLQEDIVAELLFERFRENVGTWLSSDSNAEFEPLDAIFRSDIQTRHDSRELLGQLEVMLARTEPLRGTAGFQRVLERGQQKPTDPEERVLFTVVGAGRSVAQIVRASPFEELHTLNRLALMLESGSIAEHDPTEEPTHHGGAPETRADSLPLGDADAESEEEAPEPEEGEGFKLRVGLGDAQLDEEDSEALNEEMDLFADNDRFRGGSGMEDGKFTHLGGDVVDLSANAAPTEPPTPQRDEVPSESPASVQVKYSGPMLSVGDALRKIEVANEVLRALSGAFDSEKGVGSGPSQVQLLLDGSPAEYSDIFRSVEADREGTAAPEPLIANLKRRMPSEHRHVLNRALGDLIERAMNVAADSLEDDDAIDAVMERYLGYRQRLGL